MPMIMETTYENSGTATASKIKRGTKRLIARRTDSNSDLFTLT